jgi:hypothetical protein
MAASQVVSLKGWYNNEAVVKRFTAECQRSRNVAISISSASHQQWCNGDFKKKGRTSMSFDLTERQSFSATLFVNSSMRTSEHGRPMMMRKSARATAGKLFRGRRVEAYRAQQRLVEYISAASAGQRGGQLIQFEGTPLTNLEYALCADEMGRIPWASETFNCSASDTGNMEVLARYGTPQQQ